MKKIHLSQIISFENLKTKVFSDLKGENVKNRSTFSKRIIFYFVLFVIRIINIYDSEIIIINLNFYLFYLLKLYNKSLNINFTEWLEIKKINPFHYPSQFTTFFKKKGKTKQTFKKKKKRKTKQTSNFVLIIYFLSIF